MNGQVRIDGPVRLAIGTPADLAQFLHQVHHDRGFEVAFKIQAIVHLGDRYDFESNEMRRVDNSHNFTSSFSYAVDDQPVIRSMDFNLSPSSQLHLLSADRVVEEVWLEYIDLSPL